MSRYLEKAIKILKSQLQGLIDLHEQGIIHRDPALRNAVVQEYNDGRFLCKLIDFDHSISIKQNAENFNEEMLEYYEKVMKGKVVKKGVYLDKKY